MTHTEYNDYIIAFDYGRSDLWMSGYSIENDFIRIKERKKRMKVRIIILIFVL